jgi:hypothetical protein
LCFICFVPAWTAHELLASGKRNPLVTAVPAAVSDLAECCEIVTKTCGEAADECADAYCYNGKAQQRPSLGP